MTTTPALLREGDQLPAYEFADGAGATWSTTAHCATAASSGVPLLLILHRHLA